MRAPDIAVVCMFCLLCWTTYRVYRLPEDGTGRRQPLLYLGIVMGLLFGSAVGCIIWRAL